MRTWKRLTEIDILRIQTIIDDWPLPSLTWDALVKEVEIQLGQLFSRQALERKKEIKAAFQSRKGNKPKFLQLSEAEQTILRLRQRKEELEELVRQYDLRFLRHIENARLLGIRPKDLEQPIDGE